LITNKINKILKELSKELIIEVSREVKDEMRAYLWGEIRGAIKDVLKKEEITLGSSTGFLSMEQIQKKYHVSKATICKKCKKYNVERLNSGKYKLINEFQFLEALKQKEEAPTFFNKENIKLSNPDSNA
jgi:hypothetical protein